MKVKAEPWGLELSTDNTITRAFLEEKWGVRIGFLYEDRTNKFDVVLTEREAKELTNQKLGNVLTFSPGDNMESFFYRVKLTDEEISSLTEQIKNALEQIERIKQLTVPTTKVTLQ